MHRIGKWVCGLNFAFGPQILVELSVVFFGVARAIIMPLLYRVKLPGKSLCAFRTVPGVP